MRRDWTLKPQSSSSSSWSFHWSAFRSDTLASKTSKIFEEYAATGATWTTAEKRRTSRWVALAKCVHVCGECFPKTTVYARSLAIGLAWTMLGHISCTCYISIAVHHRNLVDKSTNNDLSKVPGMTAVDLEHLDNFQTSHLIIVSPELPPLDQLRPRPPPGRWHFHHPSEFPLPRWNIAATNVPKQQTTNWEVHGQGVECFLWGKETSIYLSICPFIWYLFIYRSIYLTLYIIFQSVYVLIISIHPSSIHPSIYLSFYLITTASPLEGSCHVHFWSPVGAGPVGPCLWPFGPWACGPVDLGAARPWPRGPVDQIRTLPP